MSTLELVRIFWSQPALQRAATFLVGVLAWNLIGCSVSTHPTQPATLGRPASSNALVALLGQPGPATLEKITAGDWVVKTSGLINLEHPTALAAGLTDADEPIHLYLYVLRHPRFGTFIVDSGLEERFRAEGGNDRLGAVLRSAMKTDDLVVRTSTREWLASNAGELDGVFLTHMHLDHILGLPDLPKDTPVYTGPGETRAQDLLNAFVQGTTDRMLEGKGPIREWAFEADPAGRFAGVLDVFGDGSVFALHVPGHSPGSTAFVIRTPDGPHLLAGDVSHTRWGWEHDVEPGTFSNDAEQSASTFHRLRAFAAEQESLSVHLGHQSLRGEAEMRMANGATP